VTTGENPTTESGENKMYTEDIGTIRISMTKLTGFHEGNYRVTAYNTESQVTLYSKDYKGKLYALRRYETICESFRSE
jgi:hypothetical protein